MNADFTIAVARLRRLCESTLGAVPPSPGPRPERDYSDLLATGDLLDLRGLTSADARREADRWGDIVEDRTLATKADNDLLTEAVGVLGGHDYLAAAGAIRDDFDMAADFIRDEEHWREEEAASARALEADREAGRDSATAAMRHIEAGQFREAAAAAAPLKDLASWARFHRRLLRVVEAWERARR
jgi:hypothetical protein